MEDTVAIDFFTIPTERLRVLFVLIVLAHDRRRVVYFNVTEHPTAEWTAQQLVEAFPWEPPPKYLLRDRDAIYGNRFRKRVRGLGMKDRPSAPRSPWQNGGACPRLDRGSNASLVASAGSVWITPLSSASAISNGFSMVILLITTNGARTNPWRWIHPTADLSIHANRAR